MRCITRSLKQWQALQLRNRIGSALCVAALVACVIALALQIDDVVTAIAADRSASSPPAVRSRVWNKTEPLLQQAGRQTALALDRHLASIHAFLGERKPGSRAFAERLMSLRGKWEIVKAEIAGNSDYAAFLNTAFAQHVFPIEDLEKAVNTAIRSFLAELDGIEDELLVRLRADLADDELPRKVIPALDSEQALRSHYRELSARVAQDLRADLAFVAVREMFLFEASNVATNLTLQAGAAIAARLGISSSLLAAGAASTWWTLGAGLVVAIALDAVVNRIIQAAGYDAEEKIAQRVEETLDNLGRTITDGDPDARATLDQLKAMQRNDPEPQVRAACAEAIRSIEAGTQLYGLRREFIKIAAARASLRQETLRRLIQDQEVNP